MTSRWSLLGAATALFVQSTVAGPRSVDTIITTPAARSAYLGHAIIWQDPGEISPADLLDGPPGVFPYTRAQATAADGITCTFTTPGRMLGGKSAKFACRAPDDHELRLKYWSVEQAAGNREAFATVAATRLMWALGFVHAPALPMNVLCEDCPEDPMAGSGDRRPRRYVAMWQQLAPGPLIVSGADRDQGWSWRELDEAIHALPAGEERTRQRTHFAALTLLGVLLQHGDRKPEQHALYCLDAADSAAGEVSASACGRAAVALVDVGATFGGAGRTSNASTAKMNLERWRGKRIFESARGACRGDLTVSLAAGGGSQAHPIIHEEGRQFLLGRLRRLTADHVRAIFTAARLDKLGPRQAAAPPDPVDGWVAAFREKVLQIESQRCQPEP